MNTELSKEFPQHKDICYLNHAAVSPWPKRTAEAIQTFAQENIQSGAKNYPIWEAKENQLRKQLKNLIRAPDINDIALVKNTSEGLSMVAYGLEWNPGDEIIISDEEFPSNRIVWESLKNLGVIVTEVALIGSNIEQHIASYFSKRTKLLAISSVQYASGIRLNLESLGRLCRQHNVLFCIDAIQSLGAYDFNLETNDADFVIADGHKWLMAPEGLGLFYSKAEHREHMKVNEFGWHMVKDAGNYNTKQWEITNTAKKFECGSPNMLGVHGLSASLDLIEEIGITTIEQRLKHISHFLRERLMRIQGCSIHQSQYEQYQSAIINFSIEGKDSSILREQLMQQGVICVNRGKGIRFSPHFYISEEKIDWAIAKLEKCLP